jgi:transcription elongation factor GreA
MHDELTRVDMEKMRRELEYRENELMPRILEDVKTARSFGDLSENFEYKAAKTEQRKNMSRIRYLKQMLASAVVIETQSADDVAGLFDSVTLFMEDEGEEMTVRFVTTLRQNALEGLISKESPLGRAVLGHRAGERVQVRVSEDYSYWTQIRSITKGEDDDSLEISKY